MEQQGTEISELTVKQAEARGRLFFSHPQRLIQRLMGETEFDQYLNDLSKFIPISHGMWAQAISSYQEL